MTRKDAGFTLIEALTTLAIAAILLAIGMPAFSETLQRQRVHTAMHLITADLAMARNSAISRRTQVVACPRTADHRCRHDRDWSHGWIVFIDEDGNRQPDAETEIIRVRESAPRGMHLTSTRPFLRYQRDGRSAHSNQTIRVCAGERLAGTVVVSNLGRVRSARPAAPTACPND